MQRKELARRHTLLSGCFEMSDADATMQNYITLTNDSTDLHFVTGSAHKQR